MKKKTTSTEAQAANQWLDQFYEYLPEGGEAAQVLIPGEMGVANIWLSRSEITRYRAMHEKRIRRQRMIFAVMLVMVLMGLVMAIGQSLRLDHRNAFLGLQLAQSETTVHNLTQSAELVVQSAVNAGAPVILSGDKGLNEGLNDVAGFIEEQDEAFYLYAAFTRNLVDQHLESLNNEFDETGINLSEVIEKVSNDPRVGGPSALDDGVSEIIERYLTSSAAARLEQIAQLDVFRANLPDFDPMVAPRLTSGFGMRKHPVTGRMMPHRGVDMVSDEQRDVFSAGSGQVVFAGYRGLYGNLVVLDHGLGVETRYAHLSEVAVNEGQMVQRGDRLGVMGDTGRTTGVHLHYEVRFAGRHIDPQSVFEVARNVQ